MSLPAVAPPAGPLGKRRNVLFVILIGTVTLGIYWIYWAFKTHDEMKQHTGDGLGGVVGLVVYILISPVTAFVVPSEIGNMYGKAGKAKPVTGWTSLWMIPFGVLIIPAFVWIVKVQGALNRYWEEAATAATPSRVEPPAA